MCLNKRSCGIAFLPAITSILWESEAQKDREDFYDMCLNKRSCGIAFLPAITSILWESEAQKDREEFLRELDLKAEADHIPVHYSWVNTTCHPEWFKYFDVQSFSAPTVVYYNPQHHKHEFTIGKFTKKSLAESE